MLQGKKIILGVSGSIAAYKSAVLVRLLVKSGAEVKVIMTPASTEFIGPLTLSTLSKQDVLTDLANNDTWSNHVNLGRWADVMLIAPLSCNTLSKLAQGVCDNLLMAVYLSATCPVVVAPAMDEDMWLHETTKENISKIQSFGNQVIEVNKGELASGLFGEGRMAEPEEIIAWLQTFFTKKDQYKDKRVLITAGPTFEPIDPVRFIGNRSSGKMGIAIAKEFENRGAKVTLICGPTGENLAGSFDLINVNTAAEMHQTCMQKYKDAEIIVMTAAVADYTIENPSTEKIKKSEESLFISLKKTVDILSELGKLKTLNQLLVGFALETNDEKAHAQQKLISKNADLIVLNSLNDAGAGFGINTNKISIFDRSGQEYHFEKKTKKNVAIDIVDTIYNYINDKN